MFLLFVLACFSLPLAIFLPAVLCGTGFILSLSGRSSRWCTSDKQAKGCFNYRRCCLPRFTFYFHTPPWNSPRRLHARPLLLSDWGACKKYELLLQMSWSEWSCVIRPMNNTILSSFIQCIVYVLIFVKSLARPWVTVKCNPLMHKIMHRDWSTSLYYVYRIFIMPERQSVRVLLPEIQN